MREGWRFKQRLMIICGLLAAELAEDWFQGWGKMGNKGGRKGRGGKEGGKMENKGGREGGREGECGMEGEKKGGTLAGFLHYKCNQECTYTADSCSHHTSHGHPADQWGILGLQIGLPGP